MATVVVGVIFYGVGLWAMYLGFRIGSHVLDRTRNMALAWLAGIVGFIVIGTAVNFALGLAIPDYNWRVERLTSHD